MSLATRLTAVRAQLAEACRACGRDPDEVVLLPVSKRHPVAAITAARELGLEVFGESRVQELQQKAGALAGSGVGWQLIGSLQTNKVKALLRVEALQLVQSLDRPGLAHALQAALESEGRRLACLVQINATGEANKHGLLPAAAEAFFDELQERCPALQLQGLMAMGPLEGEAAPVFEAVAELARSLRRSSGLPLATLSMGMTGDMAAAVAAGSTMVRVGTGVFGPRSRHDGSV